VEHGVLLPKQNGNIIAISKALLF